MPTNFKKHKFVKALGKVCPIKLLDNNRGVTLVELLAASAISLLVVASVVSFIAMSADTTGKLVARNKMMADAAFLTNVFQKNVAAGCRVQPAGGFGGTLGAIETAAIEVLDLKDSVLSRLEFREDSFIVNGQMKALFTLKSTNAQSGFRVYPTSREADMWFTLASRSTTRQVTIDSFSTQISGVWCKN